MVAALVAGMAAQAEDFPLWVGATQVTSANCGNILGDGTASFVGSASGGTLSLSNARITATSVHQGINSANIYSGDNFDLTISLSGSSLVKGAGSTTSNYCVYADGNLAIAGEGTLLSEIPDGVAISALALDMRNGLEIMEPMNGAFDADKRCVVDADTGAAAKLVVIVAPLDPSAPPCLCAINDVEVDVGETASLDVRAYAPEAAPVTSLEITAGDSAARLSEGVFSFTPAAAGQYAFTISAVNANGISTISFNVNASPASLPTYLDPTTHTTNTCDAYTRYTGQTTLTSGWYLVDGSVTNGTRITVNGDVNLLLLDNAELKADGGITVDVNNNVANSLTVWAQSEGANMGKLTATGDGGNAGIGGGNGGYASAVEAMTGTIVCTSGETGLQWLLIEDVLGDVANATSRRYHVVRRVPDGNTFRFVEGDLYEKETLGKVTISYGQTDEAARAAVDAALSGANVENQIIAAVNQDNIVLDNYLHGRLKSVISEDHEISYSVQSISYRETQGNNEVTKYRYEICINLDEETVKNISSSGHTSAMVVSDSFTGSIEKLQKDGFIKTITETVGYQTVTRQLLLFQDNSNNWTAYTRTGENGRLREYGLNMGEGSFGTPKARNSSARLPSLDSVWFVHLPNEAVATLTALNRIGSGETVKSGGAWLLNGGYFKDSANDTYRFVQAADQGACGAVTVNGGEIMALAGDGAQAIGHGQNGGDSGDLTFPASYRAYSPETATVPVDAANRMGACRSEGVKLTVCGDHSYTAYRDNGGDHTLLCQYCGAAGNTELHSYGVDGLLCPCGARRYTITVEGGSTTNSPAVEGAVVTVTANPSEDGWAFVQWAMNDDVNFADASASETTFIMPTNDVTVQAVYAEILVNGLNGEGYPWTGKPIEPEVSVSLDGVAIALFRDTDYEVSYTGNTDSGTATVTVTMLPPRLGSKTVEFTILPQPSVSSVTATASDPWDGTVYFTFTTGGNWSGLPDWNKPFLSIVATDNETGSNYVADVSALSADTVEELEAALVGSNGAHTVTWDFAAQGIELASTNVTFSVAYLKMPDY